MHRYFKIVQICPFTPFNLTFNIFGSINRKEALIKVIRAVKLMPDEVGRKERRKKMFTGTEFLIAIGVLVVISAIGSVFMLRQKDEPWKYDIREKPIREDMLDDPSYHSLHGNTFHDMF